MTTSHQPFSVRFSLADAWDEAPYEGVPRHLVNPLQSWAKGHFSAGEDPNAEVIALRLRFAPASFESAAQFLTSRDGLELLDVIDCILGYVDEEGSEWVDHDGRLAELLDEGGSAYRVTAAGDALEIRLDPTVREAAMNAVAEASARPSAGSAADHLARSWQKTYGLHPDPVLAYSEAIKAVESAAHAVIQPNHARATLGTMLGELKGAGHKFRGGIPAPAGGGAAVAEAMMRALWEGQTSRHGGQLPTKPESLESARAAVHLAATLVQWFSSGAVTRI